jgi:hypothetical protein
VLGPIALLKPESLSPMAKEVVVQIGPRPEPRKFDNPAAAVMFVMEELEKSRRHNVRMIFEGAEFRFVDIVRMYAALKKAIRKHGPYR